MGVYKESLIGNDGLVLDVEKLSEAISGRLSCQLESSKTIANYDKRYLLMTDKLSNKIERAENTLNGLSKLLSDIHDYIQKMPMMVIVENKDEEGS